MIGGGWGMECRGLYYSLCVGAPSLRRRDRFDWSTKNLLFTCMHSGSFKSVLILLFIKYTVYPAVFFFVSYKQMKYPMQQVRAMCAVPPGKILC